MSSLVSEFLTKERSMYKVERDAQTQLTKNIFDRAVFFPLSVCSLRATYVLNINIFEGTELTITSSDSGMYLLL